ncbi:hypothetical protein L484_003587 [Morus notabilis]|uniref:Clavata3/ESR (CLE) gene family member n=1 Tax=Morus notabilis TaxID=981085 RepID=W9SK81_9ROSA|nr:hypothetical protein L484_003587 [Morus notabilis]
MRLTEFTVVVFLLFLACGFGSDAVRIRLSFLMTHDIVSSNLKRNSSSNESSSQELQHFGKFSHNVNSNSSSISASEDKRVVPTGSNPLHNR